MNEAEGGVFMRRRFIISLALLLCIGMLALMAGCETTKGIGRDIKSLGELMSGERK